MKAWFENFYQQESRKILATLIRLLGDFGLAEEAMQEAFAAAMRQWPEDGIPANPRGWMISTGRFKGIDLLRRNSRNSASIDTVSETIGYVEKEVDESFFRDDQLRLIFTCCHPSLAAEAQLALTLREICGLTTEEIARAFLVKPATIAQRIVRAKNKIRDAKIPYEIPGPKAMPERLSIVLHVIYLIFNEGYSASTGKNLVRRELCAEAIRLARKLLQLLPGSEVRGLLGLMLLQDSRRFSRIDENGDLVTLEEQDRSLWEKEKIAEGRSLVIQALAGRSLGPLSIQGAIAAVHAEAPSFRETDWEQIVSLYNILLQLQPSPVVELNLAVAVAMAEGVEEGLARVDAISSRGDLQEYHLLHAARADLCRRLERFDEARTAYLQALKLTSQEPERRFLQRRLQELD